jgi:hypothetical protein
MIKIIMRIVLRRLVSNEVFEGLFSKIRFHYSLPVRSAINFNNIDIEYYFLPIAMGRSDECK